MYNHHYYHSKKSKNSSTIPGKAFLILIAFLVFFLFLYSIDSLIIFRGKIYPNIFALDQSIGGLKQAQAYQTLQPVLSEILASPVLIDYEGWQSSAIPEVSLGASITLEKLFNEAYSIGRRGSLLTRIRERISLIRNVHQLKPAIEFDENKFESFTMIYK